MKRELQFEFAGEPNIDLSDLPTLLGLKTSAPTEQVLESDYFDTPDFLFRKQGAALRVRRVHERLVQTLKSGAAPVGGLYEREEYETPVDTPEPDLNALRASVPKSSPLSRLLKDRALPGHLAVVFRTTVTRRTWALTPPSGEDIELALDNGKVTAAEHEQSFSEIELELKQGDPNRLGDIALHLVDKIPLRLGMQTKSDRGYGLLTDDKRAAATAASITLKKRDTVGTAMHKILRSCLDQVEANAPLVAAANSPEGVHQMRVGLRRFRSALDLFEEVAAIPEDLAEEVKWIANELGHARDWHVLASATLKQVQANAEQRGVLDETVAAAESIEAARQADAALAVKSPRYARLMLALARWLATAPWANTSNRPEGNLQDEPIGEHASRVLRKRHRKLVRRGRGLHNLDAHHRHRARIAAKKLRYATEFFADLFQRKSMKPYRRVLATLQDDLGWGNDMAVADGLLRQLEHNHRKAAPGANYARGFLAASVADDRSNQRRLWKQFRAISRPKAV